MTDYGENGRGGRIEFTAPFEVAACAKRLERRHQGRTFWAWDWQTRLVVDVAQADDVTYRFRMRRVDRNSLMAWGSLVEVRGFMRGVSAAQTVVMAETRWSVLWIAVHLLLFAWMGVALSFIFAGQQPLDEQAAVRAVLMGLIGLLAGGWFTWWWGNKHLRGMVGALKDAMGVVQNR